MMMVRIIGELLQVIGERGNGGGGCKEEERLDT